MENKGMKFIKSLVPYSTYALIAGAVVLIETVPGLKCDKDEQNKFYTNAQVEDNSNSLIINLELKKLNEFNNIEIMTNDGFIKLNPSDIDRISYINNNEEIIISMVDSLKYYIGIFDYEQECYIFGEYICKNTKNEVHQYILHRTI